MPELAKTLFFLLQLSIEIMRGKIILQSKSSNSRFLGDNIGPTVSLRSREFDDREFEYLDYTFLINGDAS